MAEEKKGDKASKEPESYLVPPTPDKPRTTSKASGEGKDSKGLFRGLRVSLMPDELQGKATANLQRLLLVMGLVLVIESVIIGTIWFLVKSYSDKQAAKLDSLVAEVIKVQKENVSLESSASQAASFGPQIIASQAALDSRIAWTPLFRYLEAVTLPTIRYISFRADIESGMIYLSCIGQNYRDVAEQITLYNQSDKINDTRTSSVSAAVSEDGVFQGVNFSVNLTMDESIWDAANLFDENGNPVVDEGDVPDTTPGAISIPVRDLNSTADTEDINDSTVDIVTDDNL